jgi:hypothetical protein
VETESRSEQHSLPSHYERCLGPILKGWSDDGQTHGVQVVLFENQPQEGIQTLATLGLSTHELELRPGKTIRQELLISVNEHCNPNEIAGLLISLAELVLKRGRALLRGEVIGPASAVVPGSALNAVFVTNPSPLPEDLLTFHSVPPTVFAYLIPVAAAEAALILSRGWRWFEGELEAQDPDIWDLSRTEEIRA